MWSPPPVRTIPCRGQPLGGVSLVCRGENKPRLVSSTHPVTENSKQREQTAAKQSEEKHLGGYEVLRFIKQEVLDEVWGGNSHGFTVFVILFLTWNTKNTSGTR